MSYPRSRAERWRDRFVAEDPGGFSQRAALRAFLAFVLAGGVMTLIGVPLTGALIGSSMGMTVSVMIAEAQPMEQALSMAYGIASAIAAVCLAAIATSSWAAGVLLCIVSFVSVVSRARGPRATTIGMLAFMGCFFALFVGAHPAQIPLLAGSVAGGGVSAFIVRFAIVRETVDQVHASVLRAFRARVQLLLDDLADEFNGGEAEERRLRRIRRQTGRVNEAVLALEEAAGRTRDEPPFEAGRPWLLQMLDAEVGIDMLADAVHRIAAREWVAERRRALAAIVRALQQWIEHGSPEAREDIARLMASAQGESATVQLESKRHERASVERGTNHQTSNYHSAADLEVRALVWARVERAVTLLLSATPWTAFPPLPDNTSRVSVASFRAGGGGMSGMHGFWPNLRLGVQATIAVALSIVVGRAISEQRWYWAVLAAFVVFIRATTFAETVSRAWQRVLGTILGVTLGTLIAELLRRHATIEIVVALIAVLIAYALLRVWYGGMILFITIALALLYELTGQPVPGLMELRLAETAAGALIGVVVAAVVFPMHSGMRVRRLISDLLREVARVVTTAFAENGVSNDAAIHDRIRAVDLALAEVRNAVRPLWAPQVPWEPKHITRLTRTAAGIAYIARRLRTERPTMLTTEQRGVFQQLGAVIARNCNAAADALVTRRLPVLEPVAALLATLSIPLQVVQAGQYLASTNHGSNEVLRLSGQLDSLVRRLCRESSDLVPDTTTTETTGTSEIFDHTGIR